MCDACGVCSCSVTALKYYDRFSTLTRSASEGKMLQIPRSRFGFVWGMKYQHYATFFAPYRYGFIVGSLYIFSWR